ncbi:thiamine ABC transporter ATP-binding protein [Vibrio sp. TH_r3]|uniref:thiamine ABC transporter ATP-binding protein n=1 Tax=Vibrio sp. TH_r3 TaxID=3082084 RepID=UPI002953291C|nr:thiamine ABC transporter ATP-binding protein [Vibrio sp. TH_r3]MDV7105634.1 thiamine ABC transporter ATP-binding protein [Vibrio sp. TH_r3]
MLRVDDIQYRYHKDIFQFDLSINDESIVALMGPSGAGKSTLLSLIAGFIQPEKGDIQVDSKSLLNIPPHKRPFSMLFQEHNLFSHLTIRENIGLGLHPGLKLTNKQKIQVVSAAKQVGIEELLDRTPEKLSGGQKQRVALARCFVQPHSIWLLDEPFSALDPILRNEMLFLVKQLAEERGITVVMVTHHVSDAKAIATDFIFVDELKVLVYDSISSLSHKHNNEKLRTFVQLGWSDKSSVA